MTDVKLKLAPPWVTYVNEIKALFEPDPEIGVTYDNDNVELKLYVENEKKAKILDEILLPKTKTFGNVELKIIVVPANPYKQNLDVKSMKPYDIFTTVFDKNPVFSFAFAVDQIFSNVITYVVFAHKVVQFFNDNLNDVYGNVSTLYQEIAQDVFGEANLRGVAYCTDVENKVGAPLGEWP